MQITNVIVRLSSSEESKTNAILVNAHSDSTLPSPGASDDLFGCATMLEALRVMAMSPRKLTNSEFKGLSYRLTSTADGVGAPT